MPRFQRNRARIAALALAATPLLTGCASTTPSERGDSASGPTLVAESPDRQWTGVAWIGSSGEVIVNYPRWTEEYTHAVERVRIGPDGAVTRVPWPNEAMNAVPDPESLSPSERRDVLVAVQAVHTDRKGRIWILDTGNPGFAGVLEGGVGNGFSAGHAGQFFNAFFIFQQVNAGPGAFPFHLFFNAEMGRSQPGYLRGMGDTKNLFARGDFFQFESYFFRHPAADTGIYFIENHHRNGVLIVQNRF